MVVDVLVSFVLPPAAAFAAFMAVLYWFYPYPLVKGFSRYGSYWIAGLQRKFITAGGITFSFLEREPSPSPASPTESSLPITMVFVHGLSATKSSWTPMAGYLPPEWRLVMVDMPGHGESTFLPGSDYSAYGMAKKLHDFIEALQLKNVHLVGISMGSLISATYAALYPDQIESLTIMCIPVTHKLPGGVKTRFFEELEKGRILIMPHNAKEFKDMLKLVMYNPKPYMFHDRLLEAVVSFQKNNYKYLDEIIKGLNSTESKNEAPAIYAMAESIKAPTLVLWGDSDQICHPSGAAIAGKFLKNCRVEVLDRCGHVIVMDRPRKCSKLVCQFINEVISSPAEN